MSYAATASMNESDADSGASLRHLLQQAGLLARSQKQWGNEALVPMLETLGWKGDARELADLLVPRRRDLSWGDVVNILQGLGYHGEWRNTLMHHLKSSDLPGMFIPADPSESPHILLEMTDHAVLAHNVSDGMIREVPITKDKGKFWSFTPAQQPEPISANGWFRVMLQRFRGLFRDVLLLGLCINLFALAVPFFTMMVYDRVIGGEHLQTLYYLLAGASVALVAECVFRILRASSLSWFGVRANHLITLTMFERLLKLDPLTIERASPVAQLVRAKAMESVRDFLTGQGFILFIELPFLPVLLIALFVLAPPIGFICLSTAVVLCLLLVTQLRGIRAAAQRSARAMSERQRDALEIFSKLETIRQTGISAPLYQRFSTSNDRASARAGELAWRMQLVEHGVMAISMLGGLGALVLGVEQVWADKLTPGGLIASMIITWRMLMPLQQMAAISPRLEQVNGGIMQLEQLLTLPPERAGGADTAPVYAMRGQVELVNVAMRYPRQLDAVFAGLTLSVTPGEIIAVAGANGSGKSSVLKMVNGMYRQAAGSIRIDGIDIRQLDPLGLRRGVNYIPQTAGLFEGTIAENILAAAPFAREHDILQALDEADALPEILSLNDGIHTQLSRSGSELPQVLAFKVALARAYVDLKPLILCDELPYALLTSESGARFRQKLASLRGKHTVMLVAHTADLLALADHAIFLRANRRPVVGKPADILPLMLEQTHGTLG